MTGSGQGNSWGGKRPNQTGRPPVADKRTIRGLAFNDTEWEFIKAHAAKRGLSIREYLYTLVEADGGNSASDNQTIHKK